MPRITSYIEIFQLLSACPILDYWCYFYRENDFLAISTIILSCNFYKSGHNNLLEDNLLSKYVKGASKKNFKENDS